MAWLLGKNMRTPISDQTRFKLDCITSDREAKIINLVKLVWVQMANDLIETPWYGHPAFWQKIAG